MAQANSVKIGKALSNFFKVLSPDKKDISSIYILAILAGLVQLSLPLGIQTIISFVMAGSISTSIIILIVMVVIGTFLNGLLQVRQMQVIEKVQQKIFLRYSLEFANRLPKLNIEKLDSYYLPELVNRFFDTVSLQKGIDKILLDIPTAIIQITFGVILLSFYHPVFIAFGLVLLLIIFLILRFTSPQGLQTALKASEYKYGIAAWLEEMARTIKSFKYSKGTLLHLHKTDKLVSGYLDSKTDHFKILLTQFWSLITFKIIITMAMLIVGATLLVDQQINIGQFIAADIVILTIIASVEKLITNLDKIYDALTSVEKLSKITESEVEQEGTLLLSTANKGVEIEFNNVSFSYADDKQVLQNVSFKIPSGKLVCVQGISGSGKSTLLRLLTAAYKNFEGNILIDGAPIGNYQLRSLRSQTGVLLSQQDIFQGTLLENITLGNHTLTMDDVTALAKKIGLFSFIQTHKNGYDTVLDPQGKRLPKKVRQNILLLRALLGKHRLLLLEEPFDHLEEQQQVAVMDYIKNEKDSTIIITAFNEKIARECDIIFELKNGTING
ncbi:MAG: peptidase domain-containing ABC transporter [Chitinophagaceae bacterium]